MLDFTSGTVLGLSRLESYVAIMKVLSERDSKTIAELKRKPDFKSLPLEKYVKALSDMGLIKKTIEGKREYAITEKGLKILAYFEELENQVANM